MSKSEPTQFGCPALCGWGPFVAIYLGIEYLIGRRNRQTVGPLCWHGERAGTWGEVELYAPYDFRLATSSTAMGSKECVVLWLNTLHVDVCACSKNEQGKSHRRRGEALPGTGMCGQPVQCFRRAHHAHWWLVLRPEAGRGRHAREAGQKWGREPQHDGRQGEDIPINMYSLVLSAIKQEGDLYGDGDVDGIGPHMLL